MTTGQTTMKHESIQTSDPAERKPEPRPGILSEPKLIAASIHHARFSPRRNSFTYKSYYLALPLSRLTDEAETALPLAINRPAFIAFHNRDHGARDGSNLEHWARAHLASANLTKADGEIILITMPRVAGYIFNPVSFYLCLDLAGALRAVIAEVNNTFGEHHSYICGHEDQRPIMPDDTLTAKKLFHVSPFLKREGSYQFTFYFSETRFLARINLLTSEGQGEGQREAARLKLTTSMTCRISPLTAATLRRAAWQYPFNTLKTITLIHWQALKLFFKGIPYVRKPNQLSPRISRTATNKNQQ